MGWGFTLRTLTTISPLLLCLLTLYSYQRPTPPAPTLIYCLTLTALDRMESQEGGASHGMEKREHWSRAIQHYQPYITLTE